MTVRLNSSTTCGDERFMSGSPENSGNNKGYFGTARGGVNGPSLAEVDYASDAVVGENLQEERVAKSAIDDVRLTDAGTDGVETGLDLGDHAAVDDAAGDEVAIARGVEVRVK